MLLLLFLLARAFVAVAVGGGLSRQLQRAHVAALTFLAQVRLWPNQCDWLLPAARHDSKRTMRMLKGRGRGRRKKLLGHMQRIHALDRCNGTPRARAERDWKERIGEERRREEKGREETRRNQTRQEEKRDGDRVTERERETEEGHPGGQCPTFLFVVHIANANAPVVRPWPLLARISRGKPYRPARPEPFARSSMGLCLRGLRLLLG